MEQLAGSLSLLSMEHATGTIHHAKGNMQHATGGSGSGTLARACSMQLEQAACNMQHATRCRQRALSAQQAAYDVL